MKILLITTRFYPYGSATSAVVGNLAEALQNKGCDVHIVALSRRKDSSTHYEWNGIPVSFYYVPTLITKEEIRAEIKTNLFGTISGIVGKVLDILFQEFSKKHRLLSIAKSTEKTYRRALKHELRNNYDLCVTTLMPIEAVVAACDIRMGSTRFAIYQLDPFWNNDDLPKAFEDDRRKFEIELLTKCDFCITTPLIAEENSKFINQWINKYVVAEFPCLKEIKSKHSQNDIIHCVFLGTLYPDLRPPEKLIAVIAGIEQSNLVFDFYGKGQYLIKQSECYEEARNKIKLYGSVPSSVAEDRRSDADVLINIDNNSLALVPSKIFEYISTCKPIINFYFSEKSKTLCYLESYPLCLNLNLNDSAKHNADLLELFIQNKLNMSIDFETIKSIYIKNTPDYVADQFIAAYNSCIS